MFLRLFVGLFGTKSAPAVDVEMAHVHHPPSRALAVPVVVIGAASLVAGLAAATVGGWLDAPAAALSAAATGYLALWPGVNTALLISLTVIAVGAVVGWRLPVEPGPRRPWPITGERAYQFLLDLRLDRGPLDAASAEEALRAWWAARS